MPKTQPRIVNIRSALYQRRQVFPNIVTLGNLFCGFLAIIYASSGRYEKAVIAVFVGAFLDALDGRVARRLNASSKFGLELDSLADLVTFGVAPAILMYHWCFKEMADEFGVMICFIYVLCDAARLAKFNISEESSSSFSGLPSPAAAAMIVSVVNLFPNLESVEFSIVLGTLYVLFVSYLMVSNIPYASGKKIKFKNPHTLKVLIGLSICLLWYQPRATVFVVALVYGFSGPLKLLVSKLRKAKG